MNNTNNKIESGNRVNSIRTSSISNAPTHHEEVVPPFLVRTKTREEKESMRQQFKKQEARTDRGAYFWLQTCYAKVSTSFMLENKAATARDHLGTIKKANSTYTVHIILMLYFLP